MCAYWVTNQRCQAVVFREYSEGKTAKENTITMHIIFILDHNIVTIDETMDGKFKTICVFFIYYSRGLISVV